MFNYRDYKSMGLAGGRDLSGIALVIGGSFTLHPMIKGLFEAGVIKPFTASLSSMQTFASEPAVHSLLAATLPLTGACLALAGGLILGGRAAESYRKKTTVLDAHFRINSDEPGFEWIKDKPLDGYLIGYCIDTGKPVTVSYEQATRHMNIIGMTGVGKTVLGRFFMFQQILAGGGLTFIDGKYNQADINIMYEFCCWAGRKHDFLCINPGDPELSNSYNPILYGDPDEVAARVMSLVPSTESSAGSDHYKQSGAQGVTVLVASLQKAGLAYSFIDLSILMTNEKALLHLEKTVHEKAPGSKEALNLSLFLEQYKTVVKDKGSSIDVKKLKDTLGGLAGRMFSFGTGKFGEVTNHYNPEVKLFEAITAQKIIYMPLPTMGKDNAATNFGKMELGDMRTAISWAQKLGDNQKIWPPHMAFCDEIGSYATQSIARPFEQGRSANFCLIPAYQTIANLDSVSDELKEIVNGNTATKIFFQTGSQATAELISDIIGMEDQPDYTLASSDSNSKSGSSHDTGLSQSSSSGGGITYSQKIKQDYKISPDDLKKLGMGEAIVLLNGKDVFHVKIPYSALEKKYADACGGLEFNKTTSRYVKGISLFENASKYISGFKKNEDEDAEDVVVDKKGNKKTKLNSNIEITTDESV